MNLPKGNAIALQPLRPVENKTGDIFSELTFQLVKEKKAKDAAELKSMVDSGATMDDVINKINPKYANTLYQFQPKLNEQADNIMNLKAEYGSIGVTDTREKLARKRELSNQIAIANAEYERAQTFLANPETNKMLTEKLKLLSEGKLFEGDPSTVALKAFGGNILTQKRGDDGRYYIEYPENASIPFKESNKITDNLTDYLDKVLVSQLDVTDQVIKDAKTFNKTKDVTIGTDNGFRKNVTQRVEFDKDSNKKSIMVYFGLDPDKPIKEQFINPDTLSQNLKQYFYKYVGDKRNISSGEDVEKAVNSYLELAKANANEKYSNVTDVNLPSSSGGGSGSGNDGNGNEPIVASSIMKLYNADKSGKKATRFYNAEGIMMKGNAKYKSNLDPLGGEKTKEVFVQAVWNPNGRNAQGGKGNISYNLVMPVVGGSFVSRPLGTDKDKTGFNAAKKYFSNSDYIKFIKSSNEYFSIPENRKNPQFQKDVNKDIYGSDDLFENILLDQSPRINLKLNRATGN